MCDKLQLGCVVVGGGTVAMLQNKRFLALTPSLPPSQPACQASVATSWQHGRLNETGSVSIVSFWYYRRLVISIRGGDRKR